MLAERDRPPAPPPTRSRWLWLSTQRPGGDPETDRSYALPGHAGRVTEENAHQHFDTADRVHVARQRDRENTSSSRGGWNDTGAEFTLRDRC